MLNCLFSFLTDDFLSNKHSRPSRLLSNHAFPEDIPPTLLQAAMAWNLFMMTAKGATHTSVSYADGDCSMNECGFGPWSVTTNLTRSRADLQLWRDLKQSHPQSRCDRWHGVFPLFPGLQFQLWQIRSYGGFYSKHFYESTRLQRRRIWNWDILTNF